MFLIPHFSSMQPRNVQLCGGHLSDFRLPPRCTRDLRSSGIFTRRRVVIPYRRFGSSYRTHHQGSASCGNSMPTCRNLSVEMELTGCPETSVRNYHATLHEIPHKSGFQVLCSFCQSFEFVSNTLVYY